MIELTPLPDLRLSVVIPAYNEEATLEYVIRKVLKQSCVYEVIVVDDASTDDTFVIATRLSEAEPKVKAFQHKKNGGKGAAMQTGFAEVTGDVAMIQDADLEYDPDEYEKVLHPIRVGKADVVYGSRFVGSEAHRVLFFWHYKANQFLTTVSNMFTNLNLTDMETGFKAFRVEVLKQFEIKENRFGFEPEITAKVAKLNVRIYETGISYYGRTFAEGKKITWRDGISALKCIVWYNLFSR